MKADRVTGMYSKLTNPERAKLAMGYLSQCNDAELDRLIVSAPVVPVRSTAPDFRRPFDAMFNAATFYAVEYWRCRCHAAEARSAFSACALQGKRAEALKLVEVSHQWESRLAALERVLVWLGLEHAQVADLARRMTSGDEQQTAVGDQGPDTEYEIATKKILSAMSQS